MVRPKQIKAIPQRGSSSNAPNAGFQCTIAEEEKVAVAQNRAKTFTQLSAGFVWLGTIGD